jgi:ketol-acid reductoisomerase
LRRWYDKDVDLTPIKNERITVIGYGIQGAAQASNMKDSGLNVKVALQRQSKSWAQAEAEGHKVIPIEEATQTSDIIYFLIPDMVQAKVYRDHVEPHLKSGQALTFAHGAAVHWSWIRPPATVDVIMLAPKSPGQRVRETFQEGFGTPGLVAVHQDHTGRAWPRILGIAKGVGCTRAGVIETNFKEEVESDWFGEQVDLCGGVDRMIRLAFETLVDAGYQPEVAYFECLHELKLIVDLVQRYGISGMYRRVSETARFGGLSKGGIVMDRHVKEQMKKVLADVRSGKFAKEWDQMYQKEGTESFNKLMSELEAHPIEKVGRQLRSMMWPDSPVT